MHSGPTVSLKGFLQGKIHFGSNIKLEWTELRGMLNTLELKK